jgi:hypothetical protein
MSGTTSRRRIEDKKKKESQKVINKEPSKEALKIEEHKNKNKFKGK